MSLFLISAATSRVPQTWDMYAICMPCCLTWGMYVVDDESCYVCFTFLLIQGFRRH